MHRCTRTAHVVTACKCLSVCTAHVVTACKCLSVCTAHVVTACKCMSMRTAHVVTACKCLGVRVLHTWWQRVNVWVCAYCTRGDSVQMPGCACTSHVVTACKFLSVRVLHTCWQRVNAWVLQLRNLVTLLNIRRWWIRTVEIPLSFVNTARVHWRNHCCSGNGTPHFAFVHIT